jgi:adenosylhomocysteinase
MQYAKGDPAMTDQYDIAHPEQARRGSDRIAWAGRRMQVLQQIRDRFAREKPLRGIRIAACLHVTTETANLMLALADGGAEVRLCASNPLSTQDDVAASLALEHGIPVFARHGEDRDTYYAHIHAALNHAPHITMDDGADLVSTLHRERRELLDGVVGGTEETTTGVIRLRAMAADGALAYPIIAVNDAMTKHFFDNRYGTGQSTIDGIVRATNALIAGSVFVVCGYGWCGKGVALRARGMGARVIVCEVDEIKALEALMDGFEVMPLAQAAEKGDIFVTVTGDTSVIRVEHVERMKDGAILANAGHFDVEIDVRGIRARAISRREARPGVEELVLPSGKRVYLLAEGRLVNLAAAEGHPADVMDMSFANQALAVEYLVREGSSLEKTVYGVPEDIDRQVARLKLAAMGVAIDVLTEEQRRYLSSWEEGT